jgi:hypothetical protein
LLAVIVSDEHGAKMREKLSDARFTPASRRWLQVWRDGTEPLLGAFSERKGGPALGMIQPVNLLPEISQESFRKLPVGRLERAAILLAGPFDQAVVLPR